MKPLIGINADYNATGDRPGFSFVAAGYYDAVTRAGGIPVILPPLLKDVDRRKLLDRLDGVVLIGGYDLDPRRDGYMLHESVRPMDPRREDFDRAIVEEIRVRRMPVFGIGVGMQLLNVACGGTLFLHLPEDRPNAMPHLDAMAPRTHRHAIDIEDGSLVHRAYLTERYRGIGLVTSRHHQAVDDVAPGFRVTAAAPDGIIEAIESTDPGWLAIGVQWHPEAASEMDQLLFSEFVEGVKDASAHLLDSEGPARVTRV